MSRYEMTMRLGWLKQRRNRIVRRFSDRHGYLTIDSAIRAVAILSVEIRTIESNLLRLTDHTQVPATT